MKSFSDPAMAEIIAGTAVESAAVEILCDPPVRAWRGYGTLSLPAGDFDGVGSQGFVVTSNGALGGSAQNITLALSGIEPAVLELLDADELRGAPAVIWRLIFKGDSKTLLDAQPFQRGRVDQVPVEAVIGGAATISVMIETAARGLGRRGGRMRSDADQRLIKANDGSFKNASFAGMKTLYWGGPMPVAAGTALGGSYGGFLGSVGRDLIDKSRL